MFRLPEKWHGLSGLQQRLVTALVLGIAFLTISYMGGWFFTALIAVTAMLSYREWMPLVQTNWPKSLEYAAYASLCAAVLASFAATFNTGLILLFIGFITIAFLAHLHLDRGKADAPPWLCFGLFYVGVPCLSMVWLRDQGGVMFPHQWLPLLLLLVGVWMTDTCAYFTGRRIGGPKVAPKISPNKTWAGLIGGMLGASLGMGLLAFVFALKLWAVYFIAGAVLALIAQAGDFFESFMKRRAGVKDSGTIIPGHGGLLDRIDGLLTAAPCFAVLIWLLS